MACNRHWRCVVHALLRLRWYLMLLQTLCESVLLTLASCEHAALGTGLIQCVSLSAEGTWGLNVTASRGWHCRLVANMVLHTRCPVLHLVCIVPVLADGKLRLAMQPVSHRTVYRVRNPYPRCL